MRTHASGLRWEEFQRKAFHIFRQSINFVRNLLHDRPTTVSTDAHASTRSNNDIEDALLLRLAPSWNIGRKCFEIKQVVTCMQGTLPHIVAKKCNMTCRTLSSASAGYLCTEQLWELGLGLGHHTRFSLTTTRFRSFLPRQDAPRNSNIYLYLIHPHQRLRMSI